MLVAIAIVATHGAFRLVWMMNHAQSANSDMSLHFFAKLTLFLLVVRENLDLFLQR
jgi:hypothetical protein